MTCTIRHPWFNMPSAKRKHPSSESSSDNDFEGAVADVNSSKRQRCSVLEHGFAHLAIQRHSTPSTSATLPDTPVIELDSTLGTRSASPMPVDGEPSPITLPSSVEEPVSPAYSGSQSTAYIDVKMRSQSWYEPEKDRECFLCLRCTRGAHGVLGIVITDLDDSSDDDADSNSVSEAQGIHISSTLLERMKNQPKFTSVLPPKDSSDGVGALVLFRPILPSQDLAIAEPTPVTLLSKNDDDAMDVE